MNDQENISTADVVQAFKESERHHRFAKRGLEVAQAYQSMEVQAGELEKRIDGLAKTKIALQVEIKDLRDDVPAKEAEAKKIISDAQAKASTLIANAQTEIDEKKETARVNIAASEKILDGVKSEILSKQNTVDDLNTEIKRLTAIQDETRSKLAGAL